MTNVRSGPDPHFWRGVAAVLVIYAGGAACAWLIWTVM
jgi:hypothetical protein